VAARMKKITNRTLLLGVKDKFAFLTHFLQDEKLALRK
jgi:hypothetical protein